MDVPAPEGRRLDGRYRIELAGESEAGSEAAVIELWTRNGAMSEERARRRAGSAVTAAIDRDAGLVGVGTAYLKEDSHLGIPLWNYATFVAPEHREGDIAFLLLHATRDHLCERFTAGTDTRAAGMMFEVQNEILKRFRNQAIWRTSRFAFIGEDERGAHHRVFYFPGAVAPPPPGSTA